MKKNKKKIGLPPGTAVYTGSKSNLPLKITYIEYDGDQHKMEVYNRNQNLPLHQSDESKIQWYDVRGLHDIAFIEQLTKTFDVHPLAVEDIVDVHKRPSFEEYKNGCFISIKALQYNPDLEEVSNQNISLYFGKGFVLSFQEHEDDIFAILRDRILNKKGRIRDRGADYLTYAIIDLVVDHYYTVIDSLESEIEQTDFKISNNIDKIDKGDLQNIKVNLIKLRKSVVPLREVLNQFIRVESDIIDPRTETFLRNVYDHTIQVVESTDSLRDILGGLQDLYISEISLKMNQIMQFLTIVTAVFVPLSFLTGLYGMNFEYIPELKMSNGYFILWGVMLSIVIGTLLWFKRKKWL